MCSTRFAPKYNRAKYKYTRIHIKVSDIISHTASIFLIPNANDEANICSRMICTVKSVFEGAFILFRGGQREVHLRYTVYLFFSLPCRIGSENPTKRDQHNSAPKDTDFRSPFHLYF